MKASAGKKMQLNEKIMNKEEKSIEEEGTFKYYLLLLLFSNVVIWSIALTYLRKAPREYTSEWTIVLPSTASITNVNLPGIGNTSTQQDSPYRDMMQDPRENYKFLGESEPVIKTAAASLNMSTSEFGKPRVEIIDNTTLMNFQITGDSPKQAQSKASALYRAIELNLNRLRVRERVRQESEFQNGLVKAQEKLASAQKRLSAYKLTSGVVDKGQLTKLSESIENLRNQRAGVMSQWKQASAQSVQLSNIINSSAGEATSAFSLQSDPQFQQNLKDYSDASARLTVLISQFEQNHPTVLSEKAKKDAAQSALLARSKSLLGKNINIKELAHLNLNNSGTGGSPPREDLFKQMVTTQVVQQGFAKQAQELGQQITELEKRLTNLAPKETKLEELTRDVTISEAVFSSTLAKLDIGKVNPLSAYPQVETFTEPSMPDGPSSPNVLFVMLGAGLGSLFTTTGIILLWLRERRNSMMNLLSESLSTEPIVNQNHENSNHESSRNGTESLEVPKPISTSYYSSLLHTKLNDYQFGPNQFQFNHIGNHKLSVMNSNEELKFSEFTEDSNS